MDTIYIHLMIGVAIFLCFIFAFNLFEGSFAPPALLFVFGFFSSTYLYAYSILGSPNLPPNFAYENFDYALWLSGACFVSLLLGYVLYSGLNYKKKYFIQKPLNEMMCPNTAVVFSWLVLSACGFLVYYSLSSGVFSSVRGEGAYVSESGVGLMDRLGFVVSHEVGPLTTALFIAAYTCRKKLREKMLNYVRLSLFILIAITLLSFNRHLAVFAVLIILLIYHYRIRKIRGRGIFLAFSFLIILQFIRGLRNLGVPLADLDYPAVINYLVNHANLESFFIIVQSIFTGIAGWDVFTNVLNIVPSQDMFKYGSTYLDSFVGLFAPRVLGLSSYGEVTPSVWYQQMYSPGTVGHGFDFSMLAESYINFGAFMPMTFFFVGFFLAYLSHSIRLTRSPFLLFFSVVTIVVLTFGLRSDSNTILKGMFYQTLPIMLLIKFLNVCFYTKKSHHSRAMQPMSIIQ
jgi:hypothetical protein